jgi:hypothetical protein
MISNLQPTARSAAASIFNPSAGCKKLKFPKIRMTRSILTILTALLSATMLHAQTAKKASSSVEFRVTRFDPGDARPPEFRTGNEPGSSSFKVPITYIAGPFKATLRDDLFLDLWRGDTKAPEISLRIKPNERANLLLAFIPHKSGFRILKINTPLEKLKGGDRLIINATSDSLAFQLGKMKRIRILSRKSGILKGPAGKKIVSLPALIHRKTKTETGERWKLASTEQWPCDPRFRKFIFAYICPRHRHLVFHAVSERP